MPVLAYSNSIISVFFRMDEVLLNLKRGETRFSDSHMLGVDELDVWLDAVPASTSEGPVVLVGTFADEVPDQVREGVRNVLSKGWHLAFVPIRLGSH